MRRISVLAALAASLGAAETPGLLMSGSGSLGPDIMMRYRTMAEPPLKPSQHLTAGGGLRTGNARVHRYMIDATLRQYFGYDLVAEPAGPGRFRVSIGPLNVRPEDLPPGITAPAPLPKYPPPQVIGDGDTIALDLLVSPDGKQKVVDYIEIYSVGDPPPATSRTEPRDFTLDDGPLSFHFEIPMKFFVNGQPFQGMLATTTRSGGTLWMSAPGRGRYVLSLAPHPDLDFHKSGAIRDHVIAFKCDGDQFELRASGPILGHAGAWNLYVLHDPLSPARTDGVHFGVDRLDNLLPRR